MLQFYIPEIKGVEQAKTEVDEIAEKEFEEVEKSLKKMKPKNKKFSFFFHL